MEDQPAVLSILCLLLVAICVFLSIAVIDWDGMWIGAVGFCVIVPSVITATLGAAHRAARR